MFVLSIFMWKIRLLQT